MIDIPTEHMGTVTQAIAPRQGRVTDMRPGDSGRTVLTVLAPARGLLGLRSLLMTATRGTALVHQHHDGWQPWAGDLPARSGGAMVADRSGPATGFALENLQKRGVMFVGIGEAVYEGMVVGETSRGDEMVVNPTRPKELTNIRTHDHDEAVRLTPARRPTLETAIEWIAEDELVEVTPEAIRIRKRYLTESERRLARKAR